MQPAKIVPKDRLIVALDLPGVAAADAMIARLGDSVNFYKIGYQLAYSGGLPLTRELVNAGKKVFVDLKLHDIGNTVARGVESIATLGATFLTVHAYPQTMKAAVEARAGSDLKILAVTVLTSYDDGDLHAAGYRLSVSDLVEPRAQHAQVPGDAGHPARRRGGRRPEAHHDAGARDCRRRRLSGGRTSHHRSGRPQGCGRCHPGRNRAGFELETFSSEVDAGSREENASK